MFTMKENQQKRPPRTPSPLRQLVLPIFVPGVIYALGTGAVNPVLALAALALGFDAAGSSAVVGVFGVVGVLLSPAIGAAISKIGDRKALIVGSIISIVALLCSLWALWAGASLAARIVYVSVVVLLAIGANIWSLARQAYISQTVPVTHRARAMSTFGGMMRLGNLAGPLVATAVLAAFALNAVFLVQLATVIVSLAFVVAFVAPDPSMDRTRLSSETAAAQQEFDDHKQSSISATAILGVGINALTVLRANRAVIVPLWGFHLGLSEHFITATFALTMLLDAMMFFMSGILMDKRGRLWALAPSLTLMPLAIIVMVTVPTTAGFVAGSALLGFGNGFGSGIVITTGADLAPAHNKARFLGVWQAIVAIGSASGPFIISGLTAAFSLAAGLWATAAIGIFGLLWLCALISPAYQRIGIDLRGRPLPQHQLRSDR